MTPGSTESDLSVRELRAKLADVLNEAAVYGQITHVNSRGRRVGVVVGEQFYERAKADRAIVEALRTEAPDLYAKLTS